MATFQRYRQEDYQAVCDFLTRLNKEDPRYGNWGWARFEWMHFHPLTKKEQLNDMGLWLDEGRIVAATLIDMYFGEAFVAALPAYRHLYPEALAYAFESLKDDQGLGIAIDEENADDIAEVLKQGFEKVEAKEALCETPLDEDRPIALPQGFSLRPFDAEANPMECQWLLWRGFDHGEDYGAFAAQYETPSQKRPHFDPSLCYVATNERGEAVACAAAWYDGTTDFAYIEPVCVLPSYRKAGLGKAVLFSVLNQARALGAKRAVVTSDQPFYLRLGFTLTHRYPFYWKKQTRLVHGVLYRLQRLLGKGKGGYSYLAKGEGREYVLKQIHHEPCEYYQFGNKIEAERNDYQRLLDADIRIPKMVDIDLEQEVVIKEYIEGDTIAQRIARGEDVEAYLPQVREMARLAKEKGLNIDYYPTNFIVREGLLYYIDYECNSYMDEWSFEAWGIKHWLK